MSDNYYKPKGFGGFAFFPPVIKNLIIINVVVFVIQLIGQQIVTSTGLTFADIITKYFALIPLQGLPLSNSLGAVTTWHFYPWQLITYQFMHGGFAHIFFNMFALWMFGVEVENFWSSKKFLYFYLLCGVVAGIFQLYLPPLFGEALAPTIGASGAIFGVLVAFAMLFPDRYIFLYFFIPIKAKYLIPLLIIMEFWLVNSASGNIAHLAHLGGALAGFVYILLDKRSGVSLQNIFRKSPSGSTNIFNSFRGSSNPFRKNDSNVQDARYSDVGNEDNMPVTQKDIDAILDKISQSGYQNLTDREKKILFEASKKMK
ncbi:MAG: rhomboid family intramembrane serine protease [Ignavibacteriaceae bacterium]